ncbi:MAG: hypothetical protein RLZZ15_3511 [Verrucomicrobiota bacterium]|jgi:proline racemase
MPPSLLRLRAVDSHTGGEPTRLILSGGPDLGGGPLAERVARFKKNFDAYRSAIVNEPRGSDPVVGALLVPPHDPACDVGVIFFNNVGYLGMCGHGTIGLVASLAHLGKLKPGPLKIDTPVGAVDAELHADGTISVANVPSYRQAKDVEVVLPALEGVEARASIRGDVAWGGNWFFLAEGEAAAFANHDLHFLSEFCTVVREEINDQGFPDVDHVELFAAPTQPGAHSRNFVLCPGLAYDRSPCGTGTSAKLACLAADGKLAEGEPWVQESVIGSTFTARYRWLDRAKGLIAPTITGTAFVTAESELVLDPRDPFCWGIR